MRDHSKHVELKREDAIQALIDVSNFTLETESVDLHDALGRVTAHACASLYDMPSALCAQMDGIAVRFDDFAEGMPDVSSWTCGVNYGWANTGTAMPEGFDTAVRIESVSFGENGRLASIEAAPDKRGALCKQPGSDFAKGEVIVPARTRLTPAKISALAMCGYTSVDVVRKPKVVFIPTGDELVMMGQKLPAGKAYESNGILLEMKLKTWGAEPIIYPCLPDDWEQIKAALLKASDEADIVAINAGSSKGSKDFTMEILEEIGTVFYHETNHGPGRHTSASAVNGTPVLGISGPPGGCEITADWYLKPLVDTFLYGHTVEFTKATVRLAESVPPGGPGGKPKGAPQGKPGSGPHDGPGEDFFAIKPVTLEYTKDGLVAHFVKGAGHLNLLQLDTTDGYLKRNPRTYGELREGSEAEIELRYPYTAL